MAESKSKYQLNDRIGSFVFVGTELVGKNKTWLMRCSCGQIKRFWKYSAILRQKTCGCGLDKQGYSKEQRRTLKSRFQSYRSNATKRGLDWNLDYSDFSKKIKEDCTYCGAKPKEINCFENAPSLKKDSPKADWGKYTILFNGIDRLNSNLGYTNDNCVPCCKYCNRAKSDLSLEDFKNHVKRMYKCLFQAE